MIFDLSTLHLGDVLMALPAMRDGDQVIARSQHRVPGAPVAWLNAGSGLQVKFARDQHCTDAWLALTSREPVRHALKSGAERDLLVVAPDVYAPAKRWSRWHELDRRLKGAIVLTADFCRAAWMDTLNRAHTVICPDTGTAHMADALGVPNLVVLHGVPQNWPRCAPYWNRRGCIVRESMDAITVADVMEVVRG